MINKKGSTLFLAMVVMGIVLVLGIGVATILVKQIREIRNIEDERISFYIQETALDGEIVLDEWVELWEEKEKVIKYLVSEEEGEHTVTVEIDGRYYLFGDGVLQEDNGNDNGNGETEPEENAIFTYYDNPLDWDKVTMRYQAEFDDESMDVLKSTMSDSSAYLDWKINEIDTSTISAVRTYFCDGESEEVEEDCEDDGMYGWWDTTGIRAVVCVEESNDKPCNTPDTFFTYYDNPLDWDKVTMRYQAEFSDGSTNIFCSGMQDSADHSGWKENELSVDDNDIVELRSFFCQGTESACDSEGCDNESEGIYGWWAVSNTRMVCVEGDGEGGGNDYYCFSPETEF